MTKIRTDQETRKFSCGEHPSKESSTRADLSNILETTDKEKSDQIRASYANHPMVIPHETSYKAKEMPDYVIKERFLNPPPEEFIHRYKDKTRISKNDMECELIDGNINQSDTKISFIKRNENNDEEPIFVQLPLIPESDKTNCDMIVLEDEEEYL